MTTAPDGRRMLRIEARNAKTPVELFKEFLPQFAQFMKSLKQTVKAQSEEN